MSEKFSTNGEILGEFQGDFVGQKRREFVKNSAKFTAALGAVAVFAPLLNSANSTANSAKNSQTSTKGKAMNSVLNDFFTLNNGVKVPKLGLGLWRIDNAKVPAVIEAAVKVGYRHFDSAQAYGNEAGTGEGVRAAMKSGLKRSELFITTKVAAEHKDYASAKKGIEESLARLNADYIDLMLIHSPQPWGDFRGGDYFEGNLEAWRALEEAHKAGKIRAIGVSNFLEKDLANILKNGAVKPAVNQALAHIGNTPFALIAECEKQGILVEAYSPIAHGELLRDSRLVKIAQKYGVSVPQICIRYCLELGLCPLPKSATPAHIASNAQVDFTISAADMDALKALKFKDYGEHSYFPVFSGK